MVNSLPRGIRNCNPGNIRHVQGVTWQGQSATQTDDAFVQFDDPVYGIRAIVRIMNSYQRAGLSTVQGVINRWAPPNENNSAAYIDAVCAECQCHPLDIVNWTGVMEPLIRAIIQHENGQQPYTDAQITQAIELAA